MNRQSGQVSDLTPITVDDVAENVAAAQSHGGQVIIPAMDLPEIGLMAVVHDPDEQEFQEEVGYTGSF